jgi:hypothetical protein
MGGVVFFEIHADDIERAKTFYGALFGWTYERFPSPDMEYWLVITGDPVQGGGILKRNAPAAPAGSSPSAFVCTMMVESVDASVAAATSAGAVLALDKNHIPGMGWVAYLLDPEGNLFGVFQPEPTAQ